MAFLRFLCSQKKSSRSFVQKSERSTAVASFSLMVRFLFFYWTATMLNFNFSVREYQQELAILVKDRVNSISIHIFGRVDLFTMILLLHVVVVENIGVRWVHLFPHRASRCLAARHGWVPDGQLPTVGLKLPVARFRMNKKYYKLKR